MTIASALHQSIRPNEVIVVDNSSTDATPEEVPRRFGSSVRYIRQANKECAGAYNTGFAIAQGEFIQFVDGDDVLAPNKIQKQIETFLARPELDIVYGGVRMFQTLPGRADWTDLSSEPQQDILKGLIETEYRSPGITTLGTLFHRRALERVGPWDERLYNEDLDFWVRAAWAGCRFGHCADFPMGFLRQRPGQKSRNVSAILRGNEAVWEKALGYVNREPYRSQIIATLARSRFRTAVFRYDMTTKEALAKLALARATCPEMVPALAYGLSYAAIVLCGGGSSLVRSQRLRPALRVLERITGAPRRLPHL
ncbi:MAG: glycosyltransferase family 2 protein [Acidobacteria bacterium]|nr:glycosyltransferase family 2 protein [Acidobacteriota bacterium]